MLDCILDSGPVQPQFILWFKDDQVVEYSADLGRKAHIQMHRNDGQGDDTGSPFHRSHLIVREVKQRDSGRYRCSSDLTGESHIDVVVVENKQESRLEPAAAAAASSPAVDEPELAVTVDAADAAARIEQEMREPISEEMDEEQKKKASAGL